MLMASHTRWRMVEIAMNPRGYRVHAGASFKSYAPDEYQATSA
jgi:hypothetical protein